MQSKINKAHDLLREVAGELAKTEEGYKIEDFITQQYLFRINDLVIDINRMAKISKSSMEKYQPERVKDKYK